MKSYKVEVIADNSGVWSSNAIRLATEKEAKDYAEDLFSRWMAVREYCITETEEEVNYTADEYGKLTPVKK